MSYEKHIRAELSALRTKHGLYRKYSEDGWSWGCRHTLSPVVLMKMARLERLCDMAIGLPGQPLWVYWSCYQYRMFGYSSAAIGRWYDRYKNQEE